LQGTESVRCRIHSQHSNVSSSLYDKNSFASGTKVRMKVWKTESTCPVVPSCPWLTISTTYGGLS